MSYCQVITNWYWWLDTLIIALAGAQVMIKVLSSVLMVSRWLWPENSALLEVANMVVTWWIVAFCAVQCNLFNLIEWNVHGELLVDTQHCLRLWHPDLSIKMCLSYKWVKETCSVVRLSDHKVNMQFRFTFVVFIITFCFIIALVWYQTWHAIAQSSFLLGKLLSGHLQLPGWQPILHMNWRPM